MAQSVRELHASIMGAARLQPDGRSTGHRTQRCLQSISEANLKQARQIKDKLAAYRHAAEVGRRVIGELKRIKDTIINAVLCQPMIKPAYRAR